ncbi:NAD-dependent succinate-semialdehyde dehydrogenase [Salinarimonas ramus]|nr:NAD-dependent succinate-semialdehyde dehydrogenase [Salinarimonas ramus]
MTYHTPLMLIGGEWRTAASGRFIDVVDPCTEDVLGQVPAGGPDEVAEALAHARAALPVWRAVHGWERGKKLRRIAREMERRRDELARALSQEIGRPLSQAGGEVAIAIEQFDWFAGEAERLFGETIPSRQGGRLVTDLEPVGIVAAFTAWNFPINLLARKIAPALAAGCPIVCRPSEQTPATSTILIECCEAADLPPGVVQLLQGRAEDLSPALIAAPEVRKISLTGSTRVGRLVMAQAAQTVKRLSMELGGHAPVVVCESADAKAAAAACAAFKFRNAGQVCIAPNRFYVHERIAAAFTQRMVEEAEALRLGGAFDADTTMGPLTTRAQRDRVEALSEETRASGARLLTGGARPQGRNRGFFFEPTVFDEVPDDARIMREEPFGPLAPITTFTDLDDALARANSTPYGLAAYAFTRDQGEAQALSRGLKSGMVGLNTFAIAHAEAPFGGVDQSGMGREGGRQAILDYLDVKMTHFMPG